MTKASKFEQKTLNIPLKKIGCSQECLRPALSRTPLSPRLLHETYRKHRIAAANKSKTTTATPAIRPPVQKPLFSEDSTAAAGVLCRSGGGIRRGAGCLGGGGVYGGGGGAG